MSTTTKNNTWKLILQLIVSIATAIATTLGVTSCMGANTLMWTDEEDNTHYHPLLGNTLQQRLYRWTDAERPQIAWLQNNWLSFLYTSLRYGDTTSATVRSRCPLPTLQPLQHWCLLWGRTWQQRQTGWHTHHRAAWTALAVVDETQEAIPKGKDRRAS